MAGVGLGQLLLALDATLVSLVDAPRGLDLPVASVALIDSDDVRLGLAAAAGSADVFFLLGITDDEAQRWVDKQVRERVPVAIFVKEPSNALVAKAAAAGSAVVAADPRARWERLYQLVNHVLEHHGDRADAMDDSGTDLFGLAQSLAERIHPDGPDVWAQVVYAATDEWAFDVDDVVRRRTTVEVRGLATSEIRDEVAKRLAATPVPQVGEHRRAWRGRRVRRRQVAGA